MSYYDDFVRRGRRQYGDKFDTSELPQKFVRYYNSDERVRVERGDHVRTGRVGVTTGWKPAFLLMHRSSDTGSWDILTEDDQVTHVQRGRQYVEIQRTS